MQKILIVDAVEWSPEHAALDFPKDVGHWISDALGGDPDRFAYWRVTRESDPPAGPFAGAIISGSPASAYDETPWIARLTQEIRRWAEAGRPTLGVCFGHQILAHALGGRVIKNPAGWEVGSREVDLTPAGLADPLFEGLPPRLLVMESHQDIVADPPPGALVLAANRFGAQALAIGPSIRSVQFHPEYTPDRLRFIVEPRREKLARAGIDVDEAVASIRPTPDSRMILLNFEKTFILDR